MADEIKEVVKKSKFKFFTTKKAGLRLCVKDTKTDSTLNEYVRFVPYHEKYQGDNVKRGYLKTDSADIIARLSVDGDVKEISEKEYNEATDPKTARRAAL